MAVLGFDLAPLRSAIAELGQGVRQGAQQAQPGGPGGQLPGGGDYLGYLAHLAPPPAADFRPARAAPQAGPGDFLGQLGQLATGRGAFDAVTPTFAGLGQLGTGGPGQFMADLAALADRFTAQKAAAVQTVGSTVGTTGATGGSGAGATYSGLPADVGKWAAQAGSTFGDLGGWMPAAMLAIIQHESSGDPNIQNRAGYPAYGLFQLWQQPGLTADQQFQAARTLAQQKLASIQNSYAAHGLNPDERTRARDLFLAWAGHFDYDTGQPNAGSRDVGSGQDYQSYLDEIMPMYDNIVRGRQQAPSGGGGAGFAPVTGGQVYPVMQGFGATDYAAQNAATYGYETQFGMQPGQHTGIDWAAPVGTKVYSPFAGRVVYAGGTGYYTDTMDNVDPAHAGEYMVQLDNGDQIILGHLSNISAQVGQRVNAGDFVGLSGGSDGAHIHIEVRVPDPSTPSGYRIVDPTAYFGQR